jgi:hypothetical protein
VELLGEICELPESKPHIPAVTLVDRLGLVSLLRIPQYRKVWRLIKLATLYTRDTNSWMRRQSNPSRQPNNKGQKSCFVRLRSHL